MHPATLPPCSVTKWVHLNRGDEGLQALFASFHRALAPGGLNGESGKLLLDYVQPAVTGLPPLFEVPAAGPQAAGQTRVTVNLSVSRAASGKIVAVPARASTDPATWVQPVLIAPRNVGRLNP